MLGPVLDKRLPRWWGNEHLRPWSYVRLGQLRIHFNTHSAPDARDPFKVVVSPQPMAVPP